MPCACQNYLVNKPYAKIMPLFFFVLFTQKLGTKCIWEVTSFIAVLLKNIVTFSSVHRSSFLSTKISCLCTITITTVATSKYKQQKNEIVLKIENLLAYFKFKCHSILIEQNHNVNNEIVAFGNPL